MAKGAGRAAPAPSLAEVVGASGGLPEDAVLWVAAGLAGALAVLHRTGRAHGAVRPGNVLLTHGGPRLAGDAPGRDTSGRDGGAPVPAADMVALGMLLVAAYTGVRDRRPDLDQLPVRLRQVVAVCLAEHPEERATPAQLLVLIRAMAPEEPVWTVEVDDLIKPAATTPPSDTSPSDTPPPGTPVEAPPRPKAHGLSGARLALAIVAAVLVGVVITALLLLVPGRDGDTRTADSPATSRPTRLQPTEDDTPQQRTPPQQEPTEEPTPSTDPATPTSQPPPAPQRTRQTGTIIDCWGDPLAEPDSLLLYCGDAGATLYDLVWTDWGSATATARGNVSEKVCQPSCAEGSRATSTATVIVSGLADGRYTLMEVRAPQSSIYPDTFFTLGRSGPTYQG
ncbi:hypothetical protein [Streptomyces sp. LaPpAH-108]|uniref:hypothetical protein n=1 Tax=Streptomyces sp. LaPpAH-108 TaxID=1155714 RepID=UPI000373A71C|nr:hypothetical protein [Streptomyces sp. LaPpAH-108]